jgi:hypothetical protein
MMSFDLLLDTIVLPMSVSIFWSWFIPFFLKETGSAVWTMNYEGEMGSSWWQKEWRRRWLMVGDDVFIEQRRNKLDFDWLSFSWITNLELLHFYNLKLWILLINLVRNISIQYIIFLIFYFILNHLIYHVEESWIFATHGKKWGIENWKTRFPIHPLSSFSFSQSFLLVVYAIITVREKRDTERDQFVFLLLLLLLLLWILIL